MTVDLGPLPPMRPFRAHYILGMRLDYMDWEEGVKYVIDAAIAGESGYCCVPDVNECVMCYDNAEHMKIVNESLLVMSDSTILQRVRALLHGVDPSKTLRGAEIMAELCDRAAEIGLPIALIGGKNDLVLARLKEALVVRYPKLRISFAYSPPFRPLSEVENAQVTSGINQSGAKLVFVGLGCPKQERWMAQHKNSVRGIMIGLGAAFDFISGEVTPSPPWIHKAGLEWLYRLSQEPRRLWKRYLQTAPRFIWLVSRSYLINSAHT